MNIQSGGNRVKLAHSEGIWKLKSCQNGTCPEKRNKRTVRIVSISPKAIVSKRVLCKAIWAFSRKSGSLFLGLNLFQKELEGRLALEPLDCKASIFRHKLRFKTRAYAGDRSIFVREDYN